LLEAIEHITRALDQIEGLPATPTLRREQIKLQVALLSPLMHIKGYAASETKMAVERARLLIEQAEALGEPPEDPLLLFSVLYGFWVAKFVAINGQALCDLAAQFLTLAEKKGATIPLMVGHQLTGISLLFTGNIGEGRAHLDRAIALYDPAKHRPLTTRFGQDVGMMMFCRRAQALWLLGYPVAATADTNIALKFAREIGLAVSLMFALSVTSDTHVMSGNYEAAKARDDELLVLAEEKGAPVWKALGMMNQGALLR
jgi:predicted ATPase